MTCHFEAYAKSNYPGRHIVLSFWKMENIGYHCECSPMVTLLWMVVICHTIFQRIPVFFWCIGNEVKDWWFDNFTCFNRNIIYSLKMSSAHHICCSFIACNHFNCVIDQNSQLDRFLKRHILIVYYCEVTVGGVIFYSWQW